MKTIVHYGLETVPGGRVSEKLSVSVMALSKQYRTFLELAVAMRTNLAGELAHRWNQILPSLLNTYDKLRKLEFTHYNVKVIVVVPDSGTKKEGDE